MRKKHRVIPWIALRHHNYRLLWFGNTFSQFGDHMQQMAQNWLVWQLTGSVTALGLAAFVGIVPRLAFGFFGGPIVDNHNRRRLLGITQSVAFLVALGFSVTVAGHLISFPSALVFIFALEATQIVNQTTRQALLPELVPRGEITSAVSLNATGNNLARIAGPAFGGMLIPLTGVVGLMAINTVTFLGVVIAVWFMHVPDEAVLSRRESKNGFVADLKEGYFYIWQNNSLRMLIYLGMASALLVMPFTSLLPAYVDRAMHQGPQFLGFLTAAFGTGAVIGATVSPTVRAGIGGIVTLLAAVVQGAGLILFGWSYFPTLSIIALFILGIATIVYNNSVVTAMQLTAAPDYLGRVMGVYLMSKAVTNLGAMLLGTAAVLTGPAGIFILSGVLYLILGAGVQFVCRGLGAEALEPAVAQSRNLKAAQMRDKHPGT